MTKKEAASNRSPLLLIGTESPKNERGFAEMSGSKVWLPLFDNSETCFVPRDRNTAPRLAGYALPVIVATAAACSAVRKSIAPPLKYNSTRRITSSAEIISRHRGR